MHVSFSNIYEQGWVEGGAASPWIGYQKVGGNWIWYDRGNTNPETTAWAPGQPDNSGGIETVAHILTSEPTKILMNDMRVASLRYYICEVKVV